MALNAALGLANPANMELVFDMDDRARLPWRFFGAFLADDYDC